MHHFFFDQLSIRRNKHPVLNIMHSTRFNIIKRDRDFIPVRKVKRDCFYDHLKLLPSSRLRPMLLA